MTHTFDLPPGRLPVIVPKPAIRREVLADGTTVFMPYNIRYLDLSRDRDLFEIDFMLNVRQFAALNAAERFTFMALARRLKFTDDLEFPELHNTGELHYVEGSSGKLVWATIAAQVIVTSQFTALDLHGEGMALTEPAVVHEAIERAIQGCQNADADALFKRFEEFKTPHRTDISRALAALPKLGIVREYIDAGRRRRAVMNMRMIAATRSGILRGMIEAEDHCRRLSGSTVQFSVRIDRADPPSERQRSTLDGRQRRRTREEYQSMHGAERERRIAAERREAALADELARNGFLTREQYSSLQKLVADPALSDRHRSALVRLFNGARTYDDDLSQSLAVREKS